MEESAEIYVEWNKSAKENTLWDKFFVAHTLLSLVNDVSCKLMKFSVSHVESYDIIHSSLRLSQSIKE